jgi:hypothetical protein
MFDRYALNAAVAQQLADAGIPDGHKNAFALVATADGRVKGVYSAKIGDVWEIDSVVSVGKGEGFNGGVQVKASW